MPDPPAGPPQQEQDREQGEGQGQGRTRGEPRGRTMVEAIRQALHEEMERDERVMVLGEDVGRAGGIFRATKGLLEDFGEDRVVDTPLAESAILGTSIGLALGGRVPVPELQFMGFSYYAFHQFENHLARYRHRSQGRFPLQVTVRMPYGAGVHALEHHSESREAYFAHTPGLKVVVPRSPRMAWSLLKASIRDPDPVVFLEPKALYRRFREDLPEDGAERGAASGDREPDLPELGKAEVVREGDDVTVVAYGHMLHRCLDVAEDLARGGNGSGREGEGNGAPVSAEVIDLRTLAPLDSDTVVASVRKTGRCVVVHEAPRTLGLGAEVAARVAEEALVHLEAPVRRVTGYDVHPPLFALEQAYLPDHGRIAKAVRETVTFRA